jgi:signal transduction histidine kinase
VETHLRLQRQKLELKQRYDEIRVLEELRDSLVHMIVHDMRSPLHSACVGLDMLKENLGPALDPENKELCRMLHDSLTRITEMAGMMLDVHRMEHSEVELQLEVCELSDLANEVADSLAHAAVERGVSIVPERGAGMAAVAECDRELIRRVIANLADNALKYAPRDSTVLIRTSAAEDQVGVAISDDGPGIPPDQQEQIFAKFGRVESPETGRPSIGLGLTFCRMVVEAHGGTIAVESPPGHGATFSFFIPVSAATRRTSTTGAPATSVSAKDLPSAP